MDLILQQLKEATRSEHEALEEKLDILSVRSFSEYELLLERFHSFYGPLEESLAPWLESKDFDFAARRKSNLLTQDLLFFGRNTSALPAKVPEIKSFAAALGCLYVMEGATLGGQVISRHFREVLQIDEGRGLSFYSGYGADTGRKWTRFREFAASVGDGFSAAEREEALEAAVQTFALLGEHLG